MSPQRVWNSILHKYFPTTSMKLYFIQIFPYNVCEIISILHKFVPQRVRNSILHKFVPQRPWNSILWAFKSQTFMSHSFVSALIYVVKVCPVRFTFQAWLKRKFVTAMFVLSTISRNLILISDVSYFKMALTKGARKSCQITELFQLWGYDSEILLLYYEFVSKVLHKSQTNYTTILIWSSYTWSLFHTVFYFFTF